MNVHSFKKTIQTSNKNFIPDVGLEKQQKQELGWRVSVLPIPKFHHSELYNYALHVHSIQWNAIQIHYIPILVSVIFPSLFSIPTSKIF